MYQKHTKLKTLFFIFVKTIAVCLLDDDSAKLTDRERNTQTIRQNDDRNSQTN